MKLRLEMPHSQAQQTHHTILKRETIPETIDSNTSSSPSDSIVMHKKTFYNLELYFNHVPRRLISL